MSNPAKRVLCVGAAFLDTLFRVPHLPKGEGKLLPQAMVQIAEGMAASAAYAIVRLGGRADLWAAVGDDETGDRIIRELADSGIETGGMVIVPGVRSPVSTILVDAEGERLIVPFYDPALHAEPKPFTMGDIVGFDAVLVDVRWPDLAFAVLKAAREAGIPAILDGDVAPVAVLERLSAVASHIVFSEPAALALSGASDPLAALHVLCGRLPETFLCVTAGAGGSYWLDARDSGSGHQPALPVEAVDTLAAGDAFHGAFALAIAEGRTVAEAIALGSVTAALKCKVFGGRTGMPDRAAAEAALADLPSATGS